LPISPKRIRALRDGAHQDPHSSAEVGIYAFSRLHRGQQGEYVVALDNSESEKTADIPTYVGNGNFGKGVRVRTRAAHF
jgi:alpha-amylase